MMFPLDEKQIDNLKEEELGTLCYLDSVGLLLGVDEPFLEYKKRLLNIKNELANISAELNIKKVITLDDKTKIKASEQLSLDKYSESNRILGQKYGFQIRWVPSFFHGSIGPLCGACALTSESGLASILISENFKGNGRWFIYSLQEVITHELIHVARAPIKEDALEEFFAYSLSESPLRRYLGNCFRTQLASLLILLPILLLCFIQFYKVYYSSELNTTIFWLLVLPYPLFLFVRNQLLMSIFKKAKKYLTLSGFPIQNISAILFRCSYCEIKALAKFSPSSDEAKKWLYTKTKTELRWRVISKRFINEGE